MGHVALEVETKQRRCGVPSRAGKGICAIGEQGGSLSDGIAVEGRAAPWGKGRDRSGGALREHVSIGKGDDAHGD